MTMRLHQAPETNPVVTSPRISIAIPEVRSDLATTLPTAIFTVSENLVDKPPTSEECFGLATALVQSVISNELIRRKHRSSNLRSSIESLMGPMGASAEQWAKSLSNKELSSAKQLLERGRDTQGNEKENEVLRQKYAGIAGILSSAPVILWMTAAHQFNGITLGFAVALGTVGYVFNYTTNSSQDSHRADLQRIKPGVDTMVRNFSNQIAKDRNIQFKLGHRPAILSDGTIETFLQSSIDRIGSNHPGLSSAELITQVTASVAEVMGVKDDVRQYRSLHSGVSYLVQNRSSALDY